MSRRSAGFEKAEVTYSFLFFSFFFLLSFLVICYFNCLSFLTSLFIKIRNIQVIVVR